MQQKTFSPTPLTDYMIPNPQEFAHNLLQAYEQGSAALARLAERPDAKVGGAYSPATEFSAATENVTALAQRWLADPVKVAEAQTEAFTLFAALWNNVMQRMMGLPVEPLIEPGPSDNRFKDPEWTKNPFFDFCKQAYLLGCQWLEKQLLGLDGLDERERHRAEFYLRQVTSAFSPSNFLATNPEVLRETLRTNARNLVEGVKLLAEDMSRSTDLMKISQTDTSAFEVGRNLAMTPGKIVFQNDLFQLIQYTPTTDKVRERPLLMVPPWINKFYILDLTAQKSFIKYVVDQGFTVFVVSWVNPDESLSDKTFEDYLLEGILAAALAAKKETGIDQINVLGYCVGGTALSTTLAYLAQRGEKPFNSCTLLTTQVDFSLAGDLLLFTDDNQLDNLDQLMTERGFLDGSRMANVFNMMRPRDLIWPYIVSNYMLGKKPFPFDLLYWNQDFDPHGGGEPQVLSARILQREQARPRRDDDRRHQARSAKGHAAGVSRCDARRSYRAGGVGLSRLEIVRRPGRFRRRRIGSHRRRRQPARQGQVSVLGGRRQRCARARRLAEDRGRKAGLVVALLDPVARRSFRRLDSGARTRPHAWRDRGCTGKLRQGAVGQHASPHRPHRRRN